MQVKYQITGKVTLPQGTTKTRGLNNHFTLPDGSIVTVHPVFVRNRDFAKEEPVNLTDKDVRDLEMFPEFYDRTLKVIPDKEDGATYTLDDFKIGDKFKFNGMDVENRVTDIGSRVLTFIRLDQEDERNYNGPPYSIVEHVLDEYEMEGIEKVEG